jgi:hypothetical protein
MGFPQTWVLSMWPLRWFSPGTLASSTTKTGRHEIAEILLKVALNINQSNQCDYLASKEIKYHKTLRIIYYDENPVASHANK